jgi:bile acid:Na+ symporter, BASS family
MDMKDIVILAFKVSLLLTVFGFGLRATLDDVLYLFRRPGLLLRSLLAMFVIMPIVAVLLVRLFDAPKTVEIVIVALAISPIPPLLPRRIDKAGNRSAYGLGLLVTISLLSIVMVPLLVNLLGRYFDRPFAMPLSAIMGMLVKAVFLPIVAGLLVKRFLPGVADRIVKPAAIIANVLLMVVVLVLVSVSLPAFWRLIGGGTLVMMAAFILIGLIVGYLLGGPGVQHQGILGVASAARHPGIALALANANFPGEHFGPTILLYILVNFIIGVPFTKWLKSKESPLSATAD